MFDRTKPAPFPDWPTSDDIHQYARMVLMFCDLLHHSGPPYTEAMKSRMFLSHLKGPYQSLALHFNMLMGTYCLRRDGVTWCTTPLPHHLTILELAWTLDESAPRLLHHTIQAHSTTMESSLPDLTSINSRMSTSINSRMSSITTDVSRPTHIQGFQPTINRVGAPRRGRTAPNPSTRAPSLPRFEGPCEACGKYGHPTARCDMLAMALFLQRYCKNRANQTVIAEAEARWVERNKPFLPRDDRSPRTVLANYCAELQFSEDTVDAELDWLFLHDDDYTGDGTDE